MFQSNQLLVVLFWMTIYCLLPSKG